MKLKVLLGIIGLFLGLPMDKGFGQDVNFALTADRLRTFSGADLPTNRLFLLVADTSANGFGFLTDGNTLNVGDLFAGDDRILWRDDLTVTDTPGFYLKDPTLTLGGAWGVGDPLAFVWFDALTLADTEASLGDHYGFFTTTTPTDLSDEWETIGNGLLTLTFLTTDGGGSNPNSAGVASLTVVPEPSTYALLGAGLVGMWAFRRRKI